MQTGLAILVSAATTPLSLAQCTFFTSLANILKRNMQCCQTTTCVTNAFPIPKPFLIKANAMRATPPTIWGPPIWALLHHLAENKFYPKLWPQFHTLLQTLPSVLPCATCAQHFKELVNSPIFIRQEKQKPYSNFMKWVHKQTKSDKKQRTKANIKQIAPGVYKFPGQRGLWRPPTRACACGG